MKGIINRMIGGFTFVYLKNGETRRCQVRGKIQKDIYPGDEVIVDDKMVEEVLPRENLLTRPKVANVDQVILMQSLKSPEINFHLLDRFLILIEASGYESIIVINKIDLVEEMDDNTKEILKSYEKAGYNVFLTSVKKEIGIEEVKSVISSGISVLAGPSGVGKSAFLNAIIPGSELKEGDISRKLKRGMHTTREVRLLKIDEGGLIADTPGFSSLTLDNIEADELKYLYREFEPYLNQCKFNDCNHLHEPKCAVKEAVQTGELAQTRYESYKYYYKLLKERVKRYD
ncbi:MAG: ribosome small subunit-dependent GTPase A [Bacillota bacterium]